MKSMSYGPDEELKAERKFRLDEVITSYPELEKGE